jgi:hypothetical protein
MKQIAIYLAGSVKKVHTENDNKLLFDDNSKEQILQNLSDFEVIILDPNVSDYFPLEFANFGKDMLSVVSSNFLIIDLRDKRGIGVGAEMMMAKFHRIPVVSVCPPNTHNRRQMKDQEWIHPFIPALSDAIVNDFSEAARWIKNFMNNPAKVKSEKEIDDYIEVYKSKILKDDTEFLNSYKKIDCSEF